MLTLALLTGCASQTVGSPISYSTVSNSTKYAVSLPGSLGDTSYLTFETKTSFPDFPDQFQVYKTIKPEVTKDYVADVASIFGLTGEIEQGEYEFYVQVGTRSVEVYKASGAIVYSYAYTYPTVQPNLPSPEDAEAIATGIVSRLGLVPEGIKASYQGYGEIGMWPGSQLIGFKRILNGLYFAGSGAKYEVRVGDNGEITRVFLNPVNYVPEEMVALKSPEQAFEDMKNTRCYMVSSLAQKVTIEDVSLVYWLDSVMTGQDYIVPVYCFTGTCQDSYGKTLEGNFTGWVEALQ
jgi:hypothetical protein